jgi:hypothetical protein
LYWQITTEAQSDARYVNVTGDTMTGSVERMRIDSSGNVLVGTTDSNPTSSAVNVAGQSFSTTGGVRSTVASNPVATFNRKTDNGDIVLFRKDGTTVGIIGTVNGRPYIGLSDAALWFDNSNNRVVPYDTGTLAATNGTLDIGSGTQRFKDLYLSGGVVFNVAGGTGTSTSGTLDDYEEGTWVPVVLYGGSQTGQSYSIQQGRYTKIGRNVSYYGYVAVATNSSATGYLTVGGLPFTSQSGTGNLAVQTAAFDNASGNFDQPLGRIDNSSSQVMIMSGTSTNNWSLLTDAVRGSAFRVFVAGNYITDS